MCCFFFSNNLGMFSFLLMFGDVVLFFVLIFSAPSLFNTATKQQLWCLFPPLALQLGIMNKFNCGCGLFLFTGDGELEFGTILGMLVLDSIIYSCLAWYLGQVCCLLFPCHYMYIAHIRLLSLHSSHQNSYIFTHIYRWFLLNME